MAALITYTESLPVWCQIRMVTVLIFFIQQIFRSNRPRQASYLKLRFSPLGYHVVLNNYGITKSGLAGPNITQPNLTYVRRCRFTLRSPKPDHVESGREAPGCWPVHVVRRNGYGASLRYAQRVPANGAQVPAQFVPAK